LLANDDKTAVIWDLASGERLWEIEIKQGYKFSSLAMPLPHANQLAVFSPSSLSLFDLDNGACLRTTSINKESGPHAGAITPDGRYAITRDYDGRVEIWDLARLSKATEFISEGKLGGCALWNGNIITGSTLVFGDMTGRVYFLKLENAALAGSP
jgi:WD40 repeat protein